MKNTSLILAAAAILSMPFCKKVSNKSSVVVKDCTGTYLRVDNKDYHVCNTEMTDQYTNGTAVSASFKKLKECKGTAKDAIVCMMLHDSEGWIEVQKINK